MPQIPPAPAVLGEIFERPRKLLPRREGSTSPDVGDPAVQGPTAAEGAPTSGANFEGVNNVNGVLPPDPTGDVGPNHYVQMVNLSFAIYDKNGSKLYGPANANTLWQGFGGPCETTNNGDPIVLYDQLADRWMMSQFALPRFPRGPFYQCIAVSQSGDPLGAWHRYEFKIHDSKLNDYPKFGVWPDGYYMAINQFTCNFISCSWAGQGVVAFERDKMLSGQVARMVYFDLYIEDANLGGMLPSDLDGTALPPTGAPNYFSQVDDNAWGYSPDQLQIWKFSVNWTSPSLSTFTHMANLTTAAFDSNLCGYSRNCIPQPDTTVKVDTLSDRLMFRLQYRNFGTHQTLVTNQSVDVNGSDRAGIRWYELRNTGDGWNIYQQGTYTPDSHHNWMGSIAMNSQGDIALGYSKSSSTYYPSIFVTGRWSDDTLGQMTQGQTVIVNGSGHQTYSAGRWGDYSHMSVDPTDDCTFWYTQEYYAVKGPAPWQTRIGSFKLRACGPTNNAPTVSIANPAEGSTVAGTVTIQISASDEDAAGTLSVQWNLDGGTWQAAAYNSGTGKYEASWNSTTAAEGNHTINAQAADSGGKTGSDSNNVFVDNVNDPPVASFTFSCAGLTCNFNGSGSSDPDGTINSYSWNFGDGTPAGSGATPSHAYAASGTYTVVLTVTDNDGSTDDDSKPVTVSDAAPSMHVGDLDGSKTTQGPTKWKANVTITVHDASHVPLSGGTVTGAWSNGGTSSCTTNGGGQCSVSKNNISNGSVTFTVTGVTGSLTYDSTKNHDDEGDSDGNSITVNRP